MNSPLEILETNLKASESKKNLNTFNLFIAGILAGIFIAIGASSSAAASFAITNPGIQKIVAGVVFPVGLILIILLGGELFTGNCLLFVASKDKRIKLQFTLKVLLIVFISNLIGSLIYTLLCTFTSHYALGNGGLAVATIKTALTKVTLDNFTLFVSGILCNVIVCLACLLAISSKDVTGKILCCFVTILAFVISGFEHCVANMYYLPAGLFLKQNQEFVTLFNNTYPTLNIDLLNIWSILNNLVFVTLGNIIGGAGIGLLFYYKHKNR